MTSLFNTMAATAVGATNDFPSTSSNPIDSIELGTVIPSDHPLLLLLLLLLLPRSSLSFYTTSVTLKDELPNANPPCPSCGHHTSGPLLPVVQR